MSYSRAFNRLRNLITDRKLYECLMHYQSKNELDFNLGFQYAVCERVFVNTRPRYGYDNIAQLLLYVSREKFEPTFHHSECVNTYAPFNYDKLRDDVLKLIEKVSDKEWSAIDNCPAKLESDGIPHSDRSNPHETLEERKDFRKKIDMLRAFR